MRYRESTEQSAGFLRLALRFMARQEAAFHPVSYALWYEYVAGINPALMAEVDSLTQGGARLNDEQTYALYRRHIADLDAETSQRVSTSVQQIVSEVSESAAQAGDRASRFGDALERWSGALAEPLDNAGTRSAMADVLRDTHEMQEGISSLQARLEQSVQEAQRLKQEVLRAREEARVDTLTSLANRKGFDMAVTQCLSDARPGELGPCLLIVDIDYFKRINDTYGHLFGDRVLRGIGLALKANVKGRDTAARYGGEEFAVLLPATPLVGAARLAELLRATIAGGRVKRLDSEEAIGNITVSIGVASYRDGDSATDLIARADRALYVSKAQGRNRVSVADCESFDHAA